MRSVGAVFLAMLSAFHAYGQAASPTTTAGDYMLDFRYAPVWWQTSICLPDDWQKTLVGKSGELLYDYPGKYHDFSTRITAGIAGGEQWVSQRLESPRLPVVCTLKWAGGIQLEETAFAVPLPADAGIKIERLGSFSTNVNWASLPPQYDPALRNIAVGYKQPVHYRIQVARGMRYKVAFGLCEGYHDRPGQRLLQLQVEGRTLKAVDPAEKGRNVPAVYAFPARDENGDGWIDVAVAAAPNSPDKNTILNMLWVLPANSEVKGDELLKASSRPRALAYADSAGAYGPPRRDMLMLKLRNTTQAPAKAVPCISVESVLAVNVAAGNRQVLIGDRTTLTFSQPFERAEHSGEKLVLVFPERTLAAGAEQVIACEAARGRIAPAGAVTAPSAETQLARARQYWKGLNLPYGSIVVPDPQVQNLLDSCVRNIYQAREIKKGLPAFQVGPTCYRGLWVVDGSFLLEAVTYLGRTDEARKGIEYLFTFQRDDGGIMLMDKHWKETGIALWAVTRHARLTGDREWLRTVWPKVQRGYDFICKMRKMPPADSPAAGLVPEGFSDGGLGGAAAEYTNVYWTLAGMRAAIAGARWLGKADDAEKWQREYDDFYAAFRKAADRDMREDGSGHRYLPIRMSDSQVAPQKAQWAFLHAVFPGQVFAADDPLVAGNMAMLESCECEGLVKDTGWVEQGLWNYFGSFYGHAWLWLGHGDKAARALYAFANHASPLLVWREEQMPVGGGDKVVGDMPHNWASAEFIRLVRHSIVLERGDELHLFGALPAAWIKPGAEVRLKEVETEFGPVSLQLRVPPAGRSAHLHLEGPRRSPPSKVVVHLGSWAAEPGEITLQPGTAADREIPLAR